MEDKSGPSEFDHFFFFVFFSVPIGGKVEEFGVGAGDQPEFLFSPPSF